MQLITFSAIRHVRTACFHMIVFARTRLHAQAQLELQRQQAESLEEYEEIKKELIVDTTFVGSLFFASEM
jgi:hypothetical protein